MKYTQFLVLCLTIYFVNIEACCGQDLNASASTQNFFSDSVPANNLNHQGTWNLEDILTSASQLSLSSYKYSKPIEDDYIANINAKTFISNDYKTYESPLTPELTKINQGPRHSHFDRTKGISYRLQNYLPESKNLQIHRLPLTEYKKTQDSIPWGNGPQTDLPSNNYDKSRAEDSTYEKPHQSYYNSWKTNEKIPAVPNNFTDAYDLNDNYEKPPYTHYSSTPQSQYGLNEDWTKPFHPNIPYGLNQPSTCSPLPIQDSTNEPIRIGFNALLPINYLYTYFKRVITEFFNGQCYVSIKDSSQDLESTSIPQKVGCIDEGNVKRQAEVFQTPNYMVPIDEFSFDTALIEREITRPRKILKPFQDQLNALGEIYSFIEMLDKNLIESTLANKHSYHNVNAPPCVILHQGFNLREPDSSEKIVLDAFYNFQTPTKDITFEDLDIFKEKWEAESNNREEIQEPLGNTIEEIENFICDWVFQTIKTSDVNHKEFVTTALDIVFSREGFTQIYDSDDTGVCPQVVPSTNLGITPFALPAPQVSPFLSSSVGGGNAGPTLGINQFRPMAAFARRPQPPFTPSLGGGGNFNRVRAMTYGRGCHSVFNNRIKKQTSNLSPPFGRPRPGLG